MSSKIVAPRPVINDHQSLIYYSASFESSFHSLGLDSTYHSMEYGNLFCRIRDRSLITWMGGYKMRRSRVQNFSRPPSRLGKTFCAPPFKGWKLFAPPLPPSLWLKPQLKLHRNFLCPPPPSAWPKLVVPPFVGVKLHLPTALPFCSPPPPLPVTSDHSLRYLILFHLFFWILFFFFFFFQKKTKMYWKSLDLWVMVFKTRIRLAKKILNKGL